MEKNLEKKCRTGINMVKLELLVQLPQWRRTYFCCLLRVKINQHCKHMPRVFTGRPGLRTALSRPIFWGPTFGRPVLGDGFRPSNSWGRPSVVQFLGTAFCRPILPSNFAVRFFILFLTFLDPTFIKKRRHTKSDLKFGFPILHLP